MKRLTYILLALCVLSCATACGQKKQPAENFAVVGFYNVENLFDTLDDPGKDDSQFLPDGENKWTPDKYRKKLNNIARTIRAMATENGQYHAILGLAEVENDHVLKDLIATEDLKDAGFKFVHYEGGDGRGIDCALLYRPDRFKVLESKSIPYDFNSDIEFEYTKEEQAAFATRDALMVRGKLDGEPFAVYVAHLPSRRGDKGMDLRARGAEIIYNDAMALMKKYPGIKIAVMGDMNDDPVDASMTDYLHARETVAEMTPKDFFSPFMSMLKAGYGSMEYRGTWEIFDQILVNDNVVNAPAGTLKIQPIEQRKFYGRVFKPDFLIQQSGRYKGTPFRTFSNGEFIDGYSDHLPTYFILSK